MSRRVASGRSEWEIGETFDPSPTGRSWAATIPVLAGRFAWTRPLWLGPVLPVHLAARA